MTKDRMQLVYLAALTLIAFLLTLVVSGTANAQSITTEEIVTAAAQAHGIDPDLAIAIMGVESNGNSRAVGTRGELGLFQLRPEHFRGADLRDPRVNALLAASYLSDLKLRAPAHRNDWFVAFNYGPYRHLKHPERTEYYRRVSAIYNARKASKSKAVELVSLNLSAAK